MTAFIVLGFLIGLRHALEADHLAAVASLATRTGSLRQTISLGALWGLGHTLTLFLFGWLVLVLGVALPEAVAGWLEFAVGVMLVALGLDVLRRFVRDRVHFHAHRHGDGNVHFHAHSHRGETGHDPERHHHGHDRSLLARALLVGLMHGMAGSAALVVFTMERFASATAGLTYIALFGLGSIAGMAVLSVVIAVPMRRAATGLTVAHNILQVAIGIGTTGLGVVTMAAHLAI